MPRVRFIAAIAFLLLPCACTAPTMDARAQPVMTGPDGHLWIPVRCSDTLQCYSRAEFFCPTGYRVADREGHLDFNSAANRDGARINYKGMMLIQCKTCEVERRYRIDENGNFSKDPDNTNVVRLCPGDG